MQIDEKKLNSNWLNVRDRLVETHRASHLPLFANYKDDRKNPEFIGSCVTAIFDQEPLLFTNRHVFELLKGRQLTTLHPDSGDEIVVSDDLFIHEELDFAYAKINESVFSCTPVSTRTPVDIDWMYLEGYPKKHNDVYLRDGSEWTPVGLRLRLIDPKGDRAGNFDFPPTDMKNENQFLEFDLSNFTDDGLNDVPELFRPRMMSGSPLYRIGSPKPVYENPSSIVPELVGIFEEHWDKQGVGKMVLIQSAMRGQLHAL